MEHVLIVEDSRALQRALQRMFTTEAMEVDVAADGLTALDKFKQQRFDAVILDLKLPGRSGKDLCRDFKSSSPEVPIIVLSANSDVEDKVLLLELGADDYVTKPFSPKELLARLRRAMRRSSAPAALAVSPLLADELLEYEDVRVNFAQMETTKAGCPVTLTAQEYKLLRYFGKFPGRVISREELLNEVWGYNNYPTTRTVDNHILRLRQKLEADASHPCNFITVHGAGYKFVPIAIRAQSA